MKKILRLTVGFGLVLLGLVGSLLPIVPGFVFLIPGLIILAEYFRPVKRLLEWAKRKATGPEGATGGAPTKPDGLGNEAKIHHQG